MKTAYGYYGIRGIRFDYHDFQARLRAQRRAANINRTLTRRVDPVLVAVTMTALVLMALW